jgi:hypothetical protein
MLYWTHINIFLLLTNVLLNFPFLSRLSRFQRLLTSAYMEYAFSNKKAAARSRKRIPVLLK